MPFKGNAGSQQCSVQGSQFAHSNSVPVELRPASSRSGKLFPAHRIDYHCVLQATLINAAYGYGVVGDTPDEVGGAIQWINHPQVVSVFWAGPAGLFAEKSVVRVGALELANDFLFRKLIDIRYEIIGAFLAHANALEIIRCSHDKLARFACGAKCDTSHQIGRAHV